jgi:hypothetical protein
MKHVDRHEVMQLADYELVRDRFRSRVIEEKKSRRVKVGPYATALFENHDTILLQIEEMLRTERITRESSVLHEIETYNELLGGHSELSLTIMIEIEDANVRDKFLADARGLEKMTALIVNGEKCAATWNPNRELGERVSAVMYLKFSLTPKAATDLREVRDGKKRAAEVKLAIAFDHPAYTHEAMLEANVVASVAADFE